MHKLIIDVEATCSMDGSITFETSEIIEIGAVLVSEDGYIVDTFQSFVEPFVNKQLSCFCKRLTNISQTDINKADTLDLVLIDLCHLITYHFGNNCNIEFCSWSDFDVVIMRRQMNDINSRRKKKIGIGLTDNFRDLQAEFARKYKTGKKRIGLKRAVEHLGMEFAGDQHRAIDDALNTARVAMYGENLLCTA